PIRVGDIIEVRSRVAWAGRSSMIIRSEVYSEDPLTGERRLCTVGHMNFVAVDADGRPVPVPELRVRDRAEEAHREAGQRVREAILCCRGRVAGGARTVHAGTAPPGRAIMSHAKP